jgi:hypothetical protein
MANGSILQPVILPGLGVRIIDGSNSQTLDQLYFIGTANNYVKKDGNTSLVNVQSLGNFRSNSNPVSDSFRDILDGGTSEPGYTQFQGPIIGGEFSIIAGSQE